MHLLSVGGACSDAAADIFSRCLLCGACEQVCPRGLPVTRLVAEARSRFPLRRSPHGVRRFLACAALSRPALLNGLVKAGVSLRHLLALPADSGLRLRLALLEEQPAAPEEEDESEPTGGLSYFVGCFARHLQPSIARATMRLLSRCGLRASVPAGQHCCGLAGWSSGDIDQARALAEKNILAFAGADAPIITSCASCSAHLLTYPDLFAESDPWRRRAQAFADRVQEFTAFFDRNLHLPPPEQSGNALTVFYHDPCHLRFEADGMTASRRLLKKMGAAVVEPEDGPRCCGQGGLFHLACPETSAKIFARCSRQALAGQPNCITSTCSGCLMQHQTGAAGRPVRVAHLAVLLAELEQSGPEQNLLISPAQT